MLSGRSLADIFWEPVLYIIVVSTPCILLILYKTHLQQTKWCQEHLKQIPAVNENEDNGMDDETQDEKCKSSQSCAVLISVDTRK